ncbi:peptidase inhibitor family I36 protein [Streptomyces uncialis]|uniref:peptidase inhibitor family I36 protein n=1 Tax=Streptomyces uncialis TaxID=1048205 RepID=UPI0033C298A1
MPRSSVSLVVAAGATAALVLVTGPVVRADGSDGPVGTSSATAAPEPTSTVEPVDDQPDRGPAAPVIADYNGRRINLAESWEGATSCTELPNGVVNCYDTDQAAMDDPGLPAAVREEALAGLRARLPDRCLSDYWCLYRDADYKGKILRFSSDGQKNLKDWGMGNALSSVYYRVVQWSLNYGDAKVTDWRSWPVEDRVRRLDAGYVGTPSRYPNFKALDYPGGGTWNDKVDVFEVRRG